MTASGRGKLGGGGIEQNGKKKTYEHGQRCGDCWGEVGRIFFMKDQKKITSPKESIVYITEYT